MKLTELIVAIAIFLIASVVFTASLINVRRGITRSEKTSAQAVRLLDNDALIRRELQKIKIPYWKNFDSQFEEEKIILEDRLKTIGEDKGFEISDISAVYDRKHNVEGVLVVWKFYGKQYRCQELLKQRIVNEK